MRKSLFLLLMLFNGFTYASDSQNAITNFTTANEFYAQGDFLKASELYLQITELGFESADLHFNLGNTFYKTGNIPAAILHYEKALKIDPSNLDARFNLKLANLKIADKIEAIPELQIKKWWNALVFSKKADSWAWMSVQALFLTALLLAGFVATKKSNLKRVSFYSSIVTLTITLFFVILAYQQKSFIENNSFAIVFSPSLTVRSAPDQSGNKLFVIHEGAKVEILETLSDWKKISLANGNIGWVKSDDLKNI
jgi:tetratricopeptide (TPR) repeat protein